MELRTVPDRELLRELFGDKTAPQQDVAQITRKESVTIAIPFKDLEPRKRCNHQYADGRHCDMPTMDETHDRCERHWRWWNLYPTALPCPEDALSLQEMLGYAVVMLIDKQIDAEQAHAIADLGRIMEKNLARCQTELDAMARRR